MDYLQKYSPKDTRKSLNIMSRKIITTKHDEISMLADDVNKLTTNLSELYSNVKEEKKRLKDFAEVASDWLWETDHNLYLTYCSSEMQLALNIPNETNIAIDNITQLKNNSLFIATLKKETSFESLEIEISFSHNNQFLLFQGKAIINDQKQFFGYRGTAINITDLKEAQLRLEQLNENLELTVQERTQELKKSLEQLQTAQNHLIESEKLAALGGLVAGVAHEVNTPLGISVTASSIIHEATHELSDAFHAQTLTTEQFKEQIDKLTSGSQLLEQNLNRAAKLIKDFKQTAVDQVSESRDKFNVHQVLSSLITSLHPATRKVPVEPILDGDKSIIMNSLPGILTQIISNLVVNSVHHGFENNHSSPSIFISFKEKNNTIIFDYTDNGIGIPVSLHKKIFEPFFTTKRGSGGSGLGLNLVYNLINQKLKGNLIFDSEEGKGVHYIITLPKTLENQIITKND